MKSKLGIPLTSSKHLLNVIPGLEEGGITGESLHSSMVHGTGPQLDITE